MYVVVVGFFVGEFSVYLCFRREGLGFFGVRMWMEVGVVFLFW